MSTSLFLRVAPAAHHAHLVASRVACRIRDLANRFGRLQEALEFSPESPELLTTVGLLHLQQGDNQKAFESLGNALTHDPRDPKAILAAG